MKKTFITFLGILLFPLFALGEDGACEKVDRIPRVRYLHSIDQSLIVPKGGETTCVVFSEAATADQWAFYQSTTNKNHLKLENGLVVLMNEAERNAVDTAVNAPAAALQSFKNELAQSNVCSGALATMSTTIDSFYDSRVTLMNNAIDNVTNVATAKAALTVIKNQYDDERIVTKRLARCLAALIKVLGR